MKPVFDENGLATEAGNIRCFYYDPVTFEYTGWSDEYINVGVSMPGNSTDIDPGDEVAGKVAVFESGEWVLNEDHRGETVYSTKDATPYTVDYIGPVHDGYTDIAPSGPYQKWDGKKWVVDKDAQHAADVGTAEQQKAALLAEAKETISLLQTKLLMGRKLTQEETSKVNKALDYIDALNSLDISKAPNIEWPEVI